jgi:hypothetical protein
MYSDTTILIAILFPSQPIGGAYVYHLCTPINYVEGHGAAVKYRQGRFWAQLPVVPVFHDTMGGATKK